MTAEQATPRVTTARYAVSQLLRFAWIELQCCLFPALVFAGLALSTVVPLPIARYDALLIYAVAITVITYLLGFETGREVGVIFAFHLLGLALELFKVHQGSWSYPEEAWSKIAGVPLYAGVMYASVGSYICQAFRRFGLTVTGYHWLPATLCALAAYANFFTHHWIVDLRYVIAVLFIGVLWRARVHFIVGRARYWMPLWVSFLLIGVFLWLAENAATFLGAWKYPDQLDFWRMVHVGKLGSWALLVSLSFVLVAAVKAQEGRLYGDGLPAVTTDETDPD